MDQRSEEFPLPNVVNYYVPKNKNQDYDEEDEIEPDNKKKKILVIIGIVVGIIALGVIIFIIIYFIFKRKENGGNIIVTHILNENTLSSNNEITIFNVGNLKTDEFSIDEIDKRETNTLRLLEEDYTITEDGKLKINTDKEKVYGTKKFIIKFKSTLTNMDGMFKEIKSLYQADLSDFKSENIKNMNSLFLNCENLININFSKFNPKKLQTMGSAFENCKKLDELDLSYFKTPKLTNLRSTFKNCVNLKYLDISNFELNSNIEKENILDGAENVKIKINNENTKNLLEIKDNNFISNNDFKCIEGEYNCLICQNDKCSLCYIGYYLSSDLNIIFPCKECNIGCQNCSSYDFCSKCEQGYELYNNRYGVCIKSNSPEIDISTGTINESDEQTFSSEEED